MRIDEIRCAALHAVLGSQLLQQLSEIRDATISLYLDMSCIALRP